MARLIFAVCNHDKNADRHRISQQYTNLIEGVNHIKKLVMKGLIGPDSVTKFETKANLLKYHPLVMVLLLDTCYYNIYI